MTNKESGRSGSPVPPALVPVPLCGSSGTRLWPMSRQLLPEQFLPLLTEHSLLQDTALRLQDLEGAAAPLLVANAVHRFLAAEQLRALGAMPRMMLLEPVGRNTTARNRRCGASRRRRESGRSAPRAALRPPDGQPARVSPRRRTGRITRGARVSGRLFGTPPRTRAPWYGYLQAGEPIAGTKDAFRIRRFVGKPTTARAGSFLARGGFLWNGGMFAFTARGYLEEVRHHRPAIATATQKTLDRAARDLDFLRLDEDTSAACPSVSADYAVMEKIGAGAVVRADMGWRDVGSWTSLREVGKKDKAGNVLRGDMWLYDAKGCYVRSDGRQVSVLGAKDLVIVEADDAVLIASRGRAQEVKEVVACFARQRRTEYWVVFSGRARMTRDDETFFLGENQSTYIPLGARDRLENAGEAPLFIVEVESESYLGEDDIERFEDRYNRNSRCCNGTSRSRW